MPATASTLMSLLPLVGAVALVGQGARRMYARRGRAAPPGPPPMPKEMPAIERRATPKALAEGACARCGTSVPRTETVCALCALETASPGRAGWSTALSWIALAAGLGALLAAALLLPS